MVRDVQFGTKAEEQLAELQGLTDDVLTEMKSICTMSLLADDMHSPAPPMVIKAVPSRDQDSVHDDEMVRAMRCECM